MNDALNILIVNDRQIYNARYRTPVIDLLRARNHIVESQGVFDSSRGAFVLAFRLLFGRHGLVISSNLKSNAVTLLLCRRPKVVILNGLGRFRAKRWSRIILSGLLALRSNAFIIVQNYADYRYLRRKCPQVQMKWLPGSGGTLKQTGPSGTAVIIQRDSKIATVAPDIIALLNVLNPQPPLVIVGCDDRHRLGRLFSGINFSANGYVNGADIFLGGNVFLQPKGYGEGFPHTLADALVSSMEVFISNKEFLRYGLWKLDARRTSIAPGWSRLITSGKLIDVVSAENISSQTLNICETHIARSYK